MSLLLPLLTMAVTAGLLVITAGVRWLHRRDHRCTVRTRSGCPECLAVTSGRARGGHMLCACGRSSPHLAGIDLLAWRAEHHGERLPAASAPADDPAGHGTDRSRARPASTTRARAAAEAEASAFVAMMDDLGEAERRAIARARRNPDPITPQLLREAERRSRPRDVLNAEATQAAEGAEAAPGEAGAGDPDEL